MELIVCLKQVPDTAADIKPLPDGSGIETAGLPWIISPYDEFALEEAIRIKERLGQGTVTAVSLGPDRAATALRTAIAMGADRAVQITGQELDRSDAYVTAKVLAKAISGMKFDLILCGKMAVDDYDAQVGVLLAQRLRIPHVCSITKLELAPDGKTITAHSETDLGTEVIECDLPALVMAEKGLNEPRYPSVINVMKARQKPLEVLRAGDLGLSADETGRVGSRLHIIKLASPPPRGGCKLVEGDPPQAARELLRLLREEVKVL